MKHLISALSVCCLLCFCLSAPGLAGAEKKKEKPVVLPRDGKGWYLLAQRERVKNTAESKRKYLAALTEAVNRKYPQALLEKAEIDIAFCKTSRTINMDSTFQNLRNLSASGEGLAPAQRTRVVYLLGVCHGEGYGTPVNRVEALKCYLRVLSCSADAKLAVAKLLNSLPGADLEILPGIPAPMLLLYSTWLQNRKKGAAVMRGVFRDFNWGKDTAGFENCILSLAAAGDPKAMLFLAEHYASGDLFPQRKVKSEEYLRKALQTGDPEALLLFSNRLADQAAAAKSPEAKESLEKELFQLYRKLLLSGEPGAVRKAARVLADQALKEKDYKSACKYLLLLGDLQAAREAATHLTEFGPWDLYLQAKEYAKSAREKGVYQPEEYRKWLTKASNAGSSGARRELLAMQRPIPFRKYIEFLEQHPETENPAWLYEAAVICIGGVKAGKISPEKVLKFLNAAADQGNLNALNLLIYSYTNGAPLLGMKKNPALAAALTQTLIERDAYAVHPAYLEKEIARLASLPGQEAERNRLILRSIAHSPEIMRTPLRIRGKELELFGNKKKLLPALTLYALSGPSPEELENLLQQLTSEIRQALRPKPPARK